ncbi:hypothetical protein ACF09C_12740 [Streptomyces sp. NPDC014870]|uniref:hypothetical protein n=1 Tax=Streptomyces sp. NPDC014870 TaxID=3364925 RepID=UPI0036F67301
MPDQRPERIVTYRVGEHRERFHVRADCPGLTGRRSTVESWAAEPERDAVARGLEACQRCDRPSSPAAPTSH